MNPLVSVIIPTYNRAYELSRALKSVVIQSYPHWEILVVDNHSQDNTDAIVDGIISSKIKLLKIDNQGVIAVSRNLGIKHSKGKYIAFLDSDDWWLPNKLEESIINLEQGVDIVYHDLYVTTKLNQKNYWKKINPRELSSPVFDDLLINGNSLANSSVVVRKSIMQEIGEISEEPELVAMEDFDTWLRVARKTNKFSKIPLTLGYYWAGGGNVSNPERILLAMDAFTKRYSDELNKITVDGNVWWINYSKGRAYYQLKNFAKAKISLKKIILKQVPLLVAIKTQWMKLIISMMKNHGAKLR